MVIRLICLLVFGLFSSVSWALSQVSASVDKNPVFENEPFVLEVVADDSISTSAFSATPLLRLGFIVGSTQVSTHRSISNGGVVKRTAWRTELRVVRPGTFTIPAFEIEGLHTKPISIRVEKAKQRSHDSSSQDLFLTAELNQDTAYPQQQLVYTLKVHLAAELQRATLSDPVLEQADIRQLGQDTESSAIIDGRRYRIIERRYAISPTQSGEFSVASPVFKGQVLRPDRRGGYYGVPVNIKADPVTLTVKPIPSQFPGHWLPGVVASLHEEWQPDSDQISVGEPLTRTITFSVGGTNHTQIPSLSLEYPDSIKVYPDQVDNQTYVKDQLLVAQRVEAEALIPTQSGEITLPEIQIPWWNTDTESLEYAVLPARTLTVLPAQQGAQLPQLDALPQVPAGPSLFWRNLAFLFALLWLTTLALGLWLHQRNKNGQARSYQHQAIRTTDSWKNLQAGLKTSDAQQVFASLLPWLQEQYQVSSISQLAGKLDHQSYLKLQQAYQEMSAARYSAEAYEDWNADKLADVLNKMNGDKVQAADDSLPPLYPGKG